MRLLLVLLSYPLSVHSQCYAGSPSGSCQRVRPLQYQMRGVEAQPYWRRVNYGEQVIGQQQGSTGMQSSNLELNLRVPPIFAARQFRPTVQRQLSQQQPFQVSGAVRKNEVHRRAHASKSLALNKDPIDSYERALGGDEFDTRPAIRPIRVIKIESAEVMEPMRGPAQRVIGSDTRQERRQQIMKSITRHMNEIRPPKVISFPSRDEILNGQVVSKTEVKVTKIEPAPVAAEISSSEIADKIIGSILNKAGSAQNASELLQVLTASNNEATTDATTNETSSNNSTEKMEESELTDELLTSAENVTDTTLVNFKTIDKTLDLIGSEIDDYGVDEEWDEFDDSEGKIPGKELLTDSTPSGRPRKMRRRTTTPMTSTSEATPSTLSTTSTTSSPITTVSANLEEDLYDDEMEAVITSSPLTSTSADRSQSEESSEEEEFATSTTTDDEESTTSATSATTTAFREALKAAVKAMQIKMRKQKMKTMKSKEEVEVVSAVEKKEGAVESKKSGSKLRKSKITELNSEVIKSIDKDQKDARKAAKKKKKEKEMTQKQEKLVEDHGLEEEGEKNGDESKGIADVNEERKVRIPASRKRQRNRKKSRKELESDAAEDVVKDLNADLKEREQSAMLSSEDNTKDTVQDDKTEEIEDEEEPVGAGGQVLTSLEEDSSMVEMKRREKVAPSKITKGKVDKKWKKKEGRTQMGKLEEERFRGQSASLPSEDSTKDTVQDDKAGEDEDEEEPVGAGGQLLTTLGEDSFMAEMKRRQKVAPSKITKGRIDKKWKKKEGRKQMRKLEEENSESIDDKTDESTGDDLQEDSRDDVETTTAEPGFEEYSKEKTRKSMKVSARKTGKKARQKEVNGSEEENEQSLRTSAPAIKIGSEDTNIRTDKIKASLKDAPNVKYYYPPKVMVPLPTCFYNPSGYVCCNLQLNNLIEDTFEEIKNVPTYSACNIAKMANVIQRKSEEMFGHPFESVVALSDFAQNVHFAGDLVCKVEIDGKYMLTYATPYDADHATESVGDVLDTPMTEVDEEEGDEMKGDKKSDRKKKKKILKKKPLPINNFRM